MFKVVIGGTKGSGKRSFIKTLVGKENLIEIRKGKTLSLYIGTLLGEFGLEVLVISLPNEERFSEFWKVCAKGSGGYILLFDATKRQDWEKSFKMYEFLSKDCKVPFLFALTKTNLNGASSLKELKEFLEKKGVKTDLIRELDPRDRHSCLLSVIYLISEVEKKGGEIKC